MTYILIVLIPISLILGAFTAIKAIQIGLRWKIQIENKEKPTVSSPVQPIMDIFNDKKMAKTENITAEILNEWRGG